MKSTGHLHVKLIFLFAAVTLLGLSLLSYIKFQHFIKSSEWVRHTQLVKEELNHTFEELVEAESMQRGFLITKDSSFITDYSIAIQRLDHHLQMIDSLTKNNPSQQQNVASLHVLIKQRKDFLYKNMEAAVNSNVSIHRFIMGKAIMDNVRALVNKMVQEEEQLLEQRTAIFNKETLITPVFTIVFIILALIILIGSYLKIIEDLRTADTLKAAIEERERRIQNIFTAAPDAVITIDQDGVITNWNYEAETMFGWKKDEAVGKTLTETIIPERFREQHTKGMARYLSSGDSNIMNKPIEIYALHKDDGEFPVELKISASFIKGQPPVFISFIRDITKRKEIEQTLQNQTHRLLESQQLTHIGSWDWDVPTNKIEWSDELYRIYGLTPQEFKADYENFLKYTHPDDREFVDGIIQQAFKDHQPFNYIQKVLHADGTVRMISATGQVYTDSQGNTIRMAGTAQDVTIQKEYEAALKNSEERFFKIFESNPVPMTLSEIGNNSPIRYVNNAFCTLFGYSKEEIIGHTSEEMNFISPEEYGRVINVLLGFLNENRSMDELRSLPPEETEKLLKKLKGIEEMKDFEILYTKKNGETFSTLVSFEILLIGEERFTITSYQDITERKKVETLLKKQNQELESFTYISSHDLQEPLRQIQTFASRITDKEVDRLSDSSKHFFHRIEHAANRMQTLIADLLAYSRTKTAERKFEHVQLKNIVEQVITELNDRITEANATIEISDMCDAYVIPFQFSQMIHNLFGNSLKFTSPGIPSHIKIRCQNIIYKSTDPHPILVPGNIYSHISISDNGMGFEPQYKERIFEVFQRLHDKQKIPGTGIGLAIVKKIVENHNGFITATSQLNEGATLDIYIPYQQKPSGQLAENKTA